MARWLLSPLPVAGLYPRWVLANALGELIGLGAAAGAGALLVPIVGRGDDPVGAVLVAFAMVALGLVEGLVVGIAQSRALARALPALSLRRWTLATVRGAGIAWALGMLPSTIAAFVGPGPGPEAGGDGTTPSRGMVMLLAAGLGLVAGPILAAFQVAELRRHVPGAAAWLPANAAAWALGMPLVFELAHVVATAQLGVAAAAAAVVLGLALVGAVVGAVHGVVLVRLLARPAPADVAPPPPA